MRMSICGTGEDDPWCSPSLRAGLINGSGAANNCPNKDLGPSPRRTERCWLLRRPRPRLCPVLVLLRPFRPGDCVPYFHVLTTPQYPTQTLPTITISHPNTIRQAGANTPLRIYLQALEDPVSVATAFLAFFRARLTPHGTAAIQEVEEGWQG